MSNDLIRISLLMESLLDFESLHHSIGGTPKRVGEITLQDEAALKRKIDTRSLRKASQLSMCSSSKQSISIDESSMLLNLRKQVMQV